ncbi:thiamine pyrophosphate-binding protein [Streptomyces sp. NPDC055078]
MSRNPTGGEALADALAEAGVRHVFTIASVHNLPILDAIRRRTEIDVITMRHEQAVVHAADGYARSSGGVGVAIVSTGPGTANAMGGLFEAVSACSSVLLVTGQNERRRATRGTGSLHDAPRQTEMLASITRGTWTLGPSDDPGAVVRAAVARTRTPVPGPAVIEVPIDVQYGPVAAPAAGRPPIRSSPPVNRDAIARAAAALRGASTPLVIAGGGVVRSGASGRMTALAERLSIPVLTSVEGRGSIREDHPLSLGSTATGPSMRALLEEADVVLAVGTHFRELWTGSWTIPVPRRLVHVDIDPGVLGLTYPTEVAIAGDASAVLDALIAEIPPGEQPRRAPWLGRAARAAEETRAMLLARVGSDHEAVMRTIRSVLPDDAPLVRDSTVPAYAWGDSLLPVLVPGTSIRPVSAAIGPGLPLAIGAAIASGARAVAICGDGGILLSIGELAVLAQYDVPVTVCVFNDSCFGVLKGIQQATFDGPPANVDLNAPDFVALAQSFGVPASLSTSAREFDEQFTAAARSTGPHLIEIDMHALVPIRIPYGSGAPDQV